MPPSLHSILELEDPLSLNFSILPPNLQGNGGPDGVGLLEVTSQNLGPGIPVPSLSALSTSWARSLSLSTSPQPLSLPLSHGLRTPSLTPVLRQRSAEAWMLLVKGLRVSKGLSATWVGKESGKGPKAVLAHPLQALSRPHRPVLALPPQWVCLSTHSPWLE